LSYRFLEEKEKYHFIFINSETDYFSEYEEKYYKEKLSEKERPKMTGGLQTKVNKEMNVNLINKILKNDKSKLVQIKIKEYDTMKRLINQFLMKNYPYVSFAYGGFKEIHEMSLKFNIPLLNHDDNCYLCEKNSKKSIKKGFFSKLFTTDKKFKQDITDKACSFNFPISTRKLAEDFIPRENFKICETLRNYQNTYANGCLTMSK
jgi:hypothetical protein